MYAAFGALRQSPENPSALPQNRALGLVWSTHISVLATPGLTF
jgi:hypothetical protein